MEYSTFLLWGLLITLIIYFVCGLWYSLYYYPKHFEEIKAKQHAKQIEWTKEHQAWVSRLEHSLGKHTEVKYYVLLGVFFILLGTIFAYILSGGIYNDLYVSEEKKVFVFIGVLFYFFAYCSFVQIFGLCVKAWKKRRSEKKQIIIDVDDAMDHDTRSSQADSKENFFVSRSIL